MITDIDYEPTDTEIKKAAKIFSEKKDEWHIVECARCHKKISILDCSFDENASAVHTGNCYHD
jgi:hypothetical protein